MVVCLYNPAPAAYLDRPVGGSSTLDRVARWVDAVIREGGATEQEAGAGVVVYSTVELPSLPDRWQVRQGAPLSQHGLVETIAARVGDASTEIVFAYLDQPFLNVELTRRLLARHREFRAEYTFADGYPTGLAPEIVSGRAVTHLLQMADDVTRVDRSGLFPIVQKDINRLDVETELSAVDQRLLRLHLCVDTRANLLACERLAEGAPHAIDEWAAHVDARRGLHRTLPRFVSVQVIEQEVQRLAYSPYPLLRDDVRAPGRAMDPDRFVRLVDEIETLAPEAVVHLSLWGELALHRQALGLVRTVLAKPALRLLVETSGVGWSTGAAAELLAIEDERFVLIVGLDSADEEVYRQVRGDGFREAHAFADEAVRRLGSRAYLQAVRCELTEPALEATYRGWRERTENIIVGKYDWFSGRLAQRKIGDIAPIDRFPCWHLQRDLCVLVDGSVPLCREDIDAQTGMGNTFEDGLEACWNAGARRFGDHVEGRYQGICESCDEYYTFNF